MFITGRHLSRRAVLEEVGGFEESFRGLYEDQVVFASDAPFDPEGGPLYIRETIRVIDGLEITAEARWKIYQGNAERLFNRAF